MRKSDLRLRFRASTIFTAAFGGIGAQGRPSNAKTCTKISNKFQTKGPGVAGHDPHCFLNPGYCPSQPFLGSAYSRACLSTPCRPLRPSGKTHCLLICWPHEGSRAWTAKMMKLGPASALHPFARTLPSADPFLSLRYGHPTCGPSLLRNLTVQEALPCPRSSKRTLPCP
jgi:hypothetical protein